MLEGVLKWEAFIPPAFPHEKKKKKGQNSGVGDEQITALHLKPERAKELLLSRIFGSSRV